MEWTSIAALILSVATAVGGSTWLLASRLSTVKDEVAEVRSAVTEALHALDVRLTRIEAASPEARTARLERGLADLERRLHRIEWTQGAKSAAEAKDRG